MIFLDKFTSRSLKKWLTTGGVHNPDFKHHQHLFVPREAHHWMLSFHLQTALVCGILNNWANACTNVNKSGNKQAHQLEERMGQCKHQHEPAQMPPPLPLPTTNIAQCQQNCQHHHHWWVQLMPTLPGPIQTLPAHARPPTSMTNTNTTRTSANAASTHATTSAAPSNTTLPSLWSRFQASSAPFVLREAHHWMLSFHLRMALLHGILNEWVNANTSANWHKRHQHHCWWPTNANRNKKAKANITSTSANTANAWSNGSTTSTNAANSTSANWWTCQHQCQTLIGQTKDMLVSTMNMLTTQGWHYKVPAHPNMNHARHIFAPGIHVNFFYHNSQHCPLILSGWCWPFFLYCSFYCRVLHPSLKQTFCKNCQKSCIKCIAL